MDERGPLIAHYLPLVNAELQRIGFTEDDLGYLGSGGEFTRAALEAHLAELRAIPSGIGAIAYYARYGVDFAAIKREANQRPRETLDIHPTVRWELWRQDDNGNRVMIRAFDDRAAAEAALSRFESLRHKQTYWLDERAT